MRNGKFFYANIIVTVNDNGYLAQCPDIRGAFAEGDTVEEAIFNCADVIKMIADYRKEAEESAFTAIHGKDIPLLRRFNVTATNCTNYTNYGLFNSCRFV